jgi:16S rRNA processing protein RimM
MGRVAGSYGLRGWVKVVPGGGALEGLAGAAQWWIGDQPFKVAEAKVHGATVVAKLVGVETREQALKLRGSTALVERSALPEPGEGHYYHADLMGLAVVNEQGEALGVVKKLFTNGAQDVMEVAGDRTRLLPWVAVVVKEVDLLEKKIIVQWGADW